MTSTPLTGNGVVVFWTVGEHSNRSTLKSKWDQLGLGQFVPEPQPNVTCLKAALLEVMGGRQYLVRPLSNRNGFAVTKEDRGDDENSYGHVLTAKVFSETTEPVFTGDTEKAEAVLAAYRAHAGRLQSQQVGGALVKVINHFGGTRLRQSGGVYWLFGSRLNEWSEAMSAVEAASESGRTNGYVIRHDLDEASVQAVQAAIVNEVQVEAKRLYDEIHSGELGDRAIKTRKDQAAALRDKVADYENFLGLSLESLRKTLESVEQTNAVAALLAAADPFLAVAEETHHVSA